MIQSKFTSLAETVGLGGILGQVMRDFRILGHIMLDFLGDDRTCSSENKKLAVAKLCFMWPDYG